MRFRAPGHCDPVEGSDLSALVDHLVALLGLLGRDPIDLLGSGFGGYLAAGVAARELQLIRRMVLENPSVPPRPDLLAAAIPEASRADMSGSKRGHSGDPDGFAAVILPFLTL